MAHGRWTPKNRRGTRHLNVLISFTAETQRGSGIYEYRNISYLPDKQQETALRTSRSVGVGSQHLWGTSNNHADAFFLGGGVNVITFSIRW